MIFRGHIQVSKFKVQLLSYSVQFNVQFVTLIIIYIIFLESGKEFFNRLASPETLF